MTLKTEKIMFNCSRIITLVHCLTHVDESLFEGETLRVMVGKSNGYRKRIVMDCSTQIMRILDGSNEIIFDESTLGFVRSFSNIMAIGKDLREWESEYTGCSNQNEVVDTLLKLARDTYMLISG